jgi:hypothetical protein
MLEVNRTRLGRNGMPLSGNKSLSPNTYLVAIMSTLEHNEAQEYIYVLAQPLFQNYISWFNQQETSNYG